MGVKDLWSILEPVCQHKKLEDLRGQTLAVDLSIWICEMKAMKQLQGVVKPHLRNLFFRITHLLQLGINLVFVVEGTPPALKWETICKRLDAAASQGVRGHRHGAHRPTNKTMSRPQLKAIINECCAMLDYMGVAYVQSQGEAEAMCALLNHHKVVDACVTNDGDTFLYGATVVYRHFTINAKDPHVESYSMSDIENKLHLNREKLVALGLLLGCDYVPKGVPGVGRETAMKYMAVLPQNYPILKRFEVWSNGGLSHCSVCNDSVRSGRCGCDVIISEAESAIRRKASVLTNFPNKEVIMEFMVSRDRVPNSPLTWKRPQLLQLQRFHVDKLEWAEDYALEKGLPLLTLFDLTQISLSGIENVSTYLEPSSVLKARVKQGVPCYEISWKKLKGDSTTTSEHYTTMEERELFSRCFPDLVQTFNEQVESQKTAKKKGTKKKVRAAVECEVEASQSQHSQPATAEVKPRYNEDPMCLNKSPTVSTEKYTSMRSHSGNGNSVRCHGYDSQLENKYVTSLTVDKEKLEPTKNENVDEKEKLQEQPFVCHGASSDEENGSKNSSEKLLTQPKKSSQLHDNIHWFQNSPKGVSGFIPVDKVPRKTKSKVKSKRKGYHKIGGDILGDLDSPLVVTHKRDGFGDRNEGENDVDKLTEVVSKLDLNDAETKGTHGKYSLPKPTLFENSTKSSCVSTSSENNIVQNRIISKILCEDKLSLEVETTTESETKPHNTSVWNASQVGNFQLDMSLFTNSSIIDNSLTVISNPGGDHEKSDVKLTKEKVPFDISSYSNSAMAPKPAQIERDDTFPRRHIPLAQRLAMKGAYFADIKHSAANNKKITTSRMCPNDSDDDSVIVLD